MAWQQTFRIPSADNRGVQIFVRNVPGVDAMWRDLLDDLRYAVRLAGRNPLLAATVTATMVLGIAATTAVFSLVNGVLLRPFPFAHSERVLRIGAVDRQGEVTTSMAYPDLQDFKRTARSFDALAGVSADAMTLSGDGEPERISTARVDDAFARVFSLRPLLGRLFAADEYHYGANNVVVLTDRFWRRRYNGDRAVIGRAIVLDDQPHIVIGVLPPSEFTYPSSGVDLFVPLALHPASWKLTRGPMWLGVVGRLRPGMPLERARSELRGIAAGLAQAYPATNQGITVHAEPLHDVIAGDVHGMLVLLAAAVAAVLLIACANIANLLLGQSHARAREFAVRAALGGSRQRIRRQLLTESLLLSLLGGALGIALAPLMSRVLIGLYPGGLPRANEVHLDLTVRLVAVLATAVAGLLAGLPMARRAASLDLSRDLRAGGRASDGRTHRRAGDGLVISQIAISVTLLFAAGLLIQTFRRLTRTDAGFDPRGVLTFQLSASMTRFPSDTDALHFYSSLIGAIRALPGVRSVATTTHLPFGAGFAQDVYEREGKGDESPHLPVAAIDFASADYLATMRIPIVRGRGLEATDDEHAPRVLVIDETLAKRQYPGEDPVGRTILWHHRRWQIVGVAGAVHTTNLWDEPYPEIYASASQLQSRSQYLVVKSTLPASLLMPAVRREVGRLNPAGAITDITPMSARLADALAPQRFRAVLIAALGGLALALSLIGIYGVVSYAVSRQRKEISIRMALGETAARVRQRVVLNALRLGALGTVAGVVLSLGAGKWLSAFLVGVSAHDPCMLATVGATLLAVTLVAAYLPARRASLGDPSIALRSD